MIERRYEIVFDPAARQEAIEAAEYIARFSPRNALRWMDGFEESVTTLETFPARCARAPESDYLGDDLRHYLYKSHRVIFRIEEAAGIVRILYVRHAKRRAVGEPGDDVDDD